MFPHSRERSLLILVRLRVKENFERECAAETAVSGEFLRERERRRAYVKKLEKEKGGGFNLHPFTPFFPIMKLARIVKKSALVLVALAASVAAFAQESSSPPYIDVEKVDFTTLQVPYSSQKYKWAATEIKFRAQPTAAFPQDSYLTNVKMTLTLVYPQTPESVADSRVKGTRAEREAATAAAKEETGTTSKFSYYRASMTFVGLKVGETSRYVRFFIPGEIVDRESHSKSASAQRSWTGQAKPLVYWVQFTYNGDDIPLYKADGKLLSRFAIGGTEAYANQMKKETFEKFEDDAMGAVAATKGMLIPQTYVPYDVWPKKDSPTILRDEIQQ